MQSSQRVSQATYTQRVGDVAYIKVAALKGTARSQLSVSDGLIEAFSHLHGWFQDDKQERGARLTAKVPPLRSGRYRYLRLRGERPLGILPKRLSP